MVLREPTPSPTLIPVPSVEPTPEPSPSPSPTEPSGPGHPVLMYACMLPTEPVFHEVLGIGYLFDPQAEVSFAGTSATVTVTVDGALAQQVELELDAPPLDPIPVDLSRVYYDPRTDEDKYNGVSGTVTHTAIAVLTDDAGETVSHECTFEVHHG